MTPVSTRFCFSLTAGVFSAAALCEFSSKVEPRRDKGRDRSRCSCVGSDLCLLLRFHQSSQRGQRGHCTQRHTCRETAKLCLTAHPGHLRCTYLGINTDSQAPSHQPFCVCLMGLTFIPLYSFFCLPRLSNPPALLFPMALLMSEPQLQTGFLEESESC